MSIPLRVLIVEDNESDCQLLIRLLRGANYEPDVQQIETEQQMRSALDGNSWDVIISDFNLPRFNGHAALEVLQTTGMDIPFIVVSGNLGEEVAVSMMTAGAADYVMKSNLPRLIPAIKREIVQTEIRRQRKQAAHALKESEARYRQISELITDFAFSFRVETDETFHLEWITDGAQRVMGYSSAELGAEGWIDKIHPDDKAGFAERMNNVVSGETDASVFRIIRKDGKTGWLHAHFRPVWDGDGNRVTGMYGAARDISKLKKAEDALRESEQSARETVNSLSAHLAIIAEFRDPNAGFHTQRTRLYVKLLLEKLEAVLPYSANERELVWQAAPLHDIGKVAIPDSIVLKPGKLSTEEFELMKRHTTYGCEAIQRTEKLLGASSFLNFAREIAEFHHEKWDGSGYPKGLKGQEIPFSARIMALADVYDALLSERPYKKAISHEEALAVIRAGIGSHFDPQIVKTFLENHLEFEVLASGYRNQE